MPDQLQQEVASVLTLIGQGKGTPSPKAGDGDRDRSADRLIAEVYDRLRALAQEHLGRERTGHTLDATAVVHEAYLRLAAQDAAKWRDREHFFAVAATMIRRILVDHARGKQAQKRGGSRERVTLNTGSDIAATPRVDVLAMDDALRELAALSERQARIVEMRYFAGLTIDQTAAALAVSTTTVENEWAVARAWLRRRLSKDTRA